MRPRNHLVLTACFAAACGRALDTSEDDPSTTSAPSPGATTPGVTTPGATSSPDGVAVVSVATTSGAWTFEDVAQAGTNVDPFGAVTLTWSGDTSIALDGEGGVYVAYGMDVADDSSATYDSTAASFRAPSGWSAVAIDASAQSGYQTQVRTGGDGLARVLYGYSDGLSVATLQGNRLESSLASFGTFAFGRALAVDPAGRIHVASANGDTSGNEVDYVLVDDTGAHALERVVASSLPPNAVSIALRADDTPIVSYADDSGLYVATRGEAGWVVQPVETISAGQMIGTSIAADTSGIRIAYLRQDPDTGEGLAHNHVRYATFDGASWQREELGGMEADSVALALDDAGGAHVVFSRANELDYAVRDASGWTAQPIIAHAVTTPALALDVTGHPHVSFGDTSDGWIKYARN